MKAGKTDTDKQRKITMPNMDYYNKVILPIMQGEYDDYLDNFVQACQNRKKDMAPKIYEFNIGDVVRFNTSTRPKYLQGKTAKVVKVNRSKIVVKIDGMDPYAKYSGDVTVPLALIEKV